MKREEFLRTVLDSKLEYLIVTCKEKEKNGELLNKIEVHFKTDGHAKSHFDERTRRVLLEDFQESYPTFMIN